MFINPNVSQYDNVETFKYTDKPIESYCDKKSSFNNIKYIVFKKSKQKIKKSLKKYKYIKYYKKKKKIDLNN
mgnify:CR=1 FL=1